MSDHCPKCGAEDCGTTEELQVGNFEGGFDVPDYEWVETEDCLRNQLAQANALLDECREAISGIHREAVGVCNGKAPSISWHWIRDTYSGLLKRLDLAKRKEAGDE